MHVKIRVLILAYACEPHKGSEPGIGWSWVMELAKRPEIEVFVLTRANNRSVIDNELLEMSSMQPNIQFFYYDLPFWVLKIKKRLGASNYITCFGVYFAGKRLSV